MKKAIHYALILVSSVMCLSLSSCGGGGGGGGKKTTNNGTTNNSGGNSDNSGGDNSETNTENNSNTNNQNNNQTKDYAPDSLPGSFEMESYNDFFSISGGGSCRYGFTSSAALRYDGRCTYKKTGTNKAQLVCTNLANSSAGLTYTYITGTLEFLSASKVYYSAEYATRNYKGKVTPGTIDRNYTYTMK